MSTQASSLLLKPMVDTSLPILSILNMAEFLSLKTWNMLFSKVSTGVIGRDSFA